MFYEYSGVDRCGKTTLAVGHILDLLEETKDDRNGFRPEDFWGNTAIFLQGYHHVNSDVLLERLDKALTDREYHIGFFFDEATDILPARAFSNKTQTHVATKIWQNEKLFQRIYAVTNTGNAIDTILDQAIHITYLPRYVEKEDSIYYQACFKRYLATNDYVRRNVSVDQQMFNSWLAVR